MLYISCRKKPVSNSNSKMVAPTHKELELMEIFQGRVCLLSMVLPKSQTTSAHLLRWIRAREGDLTKAEDMLRKHLTWRKERAINSDLLEWTPNPFLTSSYPVRLLGFDSEGCPVLFTRFGAWDMREAVNKGLTKEMIRYKDKLLEQLLFFMQVFEEVKKKEKSVTQFVGVADWTGFSLRYIMSREVVEIIRDAASSFEANYPETLKAGVNVNCPKVFTVFFNLIKPFLSERTISKIFIYGNEPSKFEGHIEKILSCPLKEKAVESIRNCKAKEGVETHRLRRKEDVENFIKSSHVM